jgi:DNA repair photolyase
VWLSGVCDPYQPLESKYALSRKCLEILVQNNWPVFIRTRSPLVVRDVDILKGAKSVEVGLTITSANDEIRKIFEPKAPSLLERLSTIESLHQNGIKTYVMIAPILPEAEDLVRILADEVDYIIIDRMNYRHADWIYKKYAWDDKNADDYFIQAGRKISNECKKLGVLKPLLLKEAAVRLPRDWVSGRGNNFMVNVLHERTL